MSSRCKVFITVLGVFLVLILFLTSLFVGSVSIPFSDVFAIIFGGEPERESWKYIIYESRFPQAVTAMFSGSALAVSGLLLQTLFSNPLAGPSILGINSGASLGVAVVMLFMGGGACGFSFFLSVVSAAFFGAVLMLFLVLFFSSVVRSNVIVLIIGMMMGYLASSVISLLNYFSSAENVHSYVIWGMGSFSGVSAVVIPFFSVLMLLGLMFSVFLIKPLNALLLGDRYAENLGVNIKKIRNLVFVVVGLLTAVVTAFCGPISFIGLAVPHIARMLLKTSNHNFLLPNTMLLGAFFSLLCNVVCSLPGRAGVLPLNAVTPFVGVPVIIYVVLNHRRLS